MSSSLNSPEWLTAIKTQNTCCIKLCRREEALAHPLRYTQVEERFYRRNNTDRKSSLTPSLTDICNSFEGIDPLTKFSLEIADPLSEQIHSGEQQNSKYEFEPWESRKANILTQFTTSEKLSIVTSYLNDDDQGPVKPHNSSIDKVHHRLEQLDYFEEGSQKKFNLSQVEYINRIDQLNKELVLAWNSEQKVKALKISIQCAKMLADTDVLHFYPSKFVLITDILDIFGNLVYDRLKNKEDCETSSVLPEDFTSDLISASTKETCKNWFYKIASIRELVPRIYLEMAILRCYSFIATTEYSDALMRLTRMIRGIGNPLVATYARCYLCRVGISITSLAKNNVYLHENFYNFLHSYNQLFSGRVKQDLNKQKIKTSSYLTLYIPAIEYILQAIAVNENELFLVKILEKCQEQEHRSLLINTMMSVLKPSYVSERCLRFLDMIQSLNDEEFPLHILLKTLGKCVVKSAPLQHERKQIFCIVLKFITNIMNPEFYIHCADIWVHFAVKYFPISEGELNAILSDVIKHIAMKKVDEKIFIQLKNVVENIVLHIPDVEAFLAMDTFLSFIDLFHHEQIKEEVCKIILTAVCDSDQITSDPVIINTLTYMSAILHDSINALTIDDEHKQISEIICKVLQKVDHAQNFEQQLSLYVEARGLFYNLNAVLVQLVQSVNLLSVKVRSRVNGNHTRKTGSFVRACAAYCFITIPSITSLESQLDLYLLSGQVALFNNCLGQADSCFKTALMMLTDLVKTERDQSIDDEYLVAYVKKFLSTLLVIPDSPDKGALHLTRILLNFIQMCPWSHERILVELYLNVLNILSTMAQTTYPYYIDKVESNATLYGSEAKFITEINKMCTIILNEIFSKLKRFEQATLQSVLSLKLIVAIISRGDITKNNTSLALAIKFWEMSSRHASDRKMLDATKEFLSKGIYPEQDINSLLTKLQPTY